MSNSRACVDDLEVDVFAFGLLTNFRGELFDGTKRMLELADEHTPLQVEARCWCGARATHNARVVNGGVVYEGDTVMVGDTDDHEQPLFGDAVRYELLCRNHFRSGDLGACRFRRSVRPDETRSSTPAAGQPPGAVRPTARQRYDTAGGAHAPADAECDRAEAVRALRPHR